MTLPMEEKVALAREAYGALGRDDWDALGKLLSQDFELQRAGGMGMIEGLSEVREFRTPEAFDWQHDEPDGEFIESGDRLLVGIRSRARGSGSAIELEQPVFHVVTFRDGKVARLEVHFDRADAIRSLKER